MSTVQKLETRQVQLRETYERQKMDVQNLTQEKNQISKYLDTKVCKKWKCYLNFLKTGLQFNNVYLFVNLFAFFFTLLGKTTENYGFIFLFYLNFAPGATAVVIGRGSDCSKRYSGFPTTRVGH